MWTTASRAVGIAGVLLLAGGAIAGWDPLIGLGVAALVALVAAALYLLFQPELEVHRILSPNRVTVGEDAIDVLTVSNPEGQASSALVAYEQIDGRLQEVEVPRIGRRASTSVQFVLPTERRGLIEVGPLLVRRSDPLALVRADRSYGGADTLWVHPRRHVVPPLPSHLLRSLEGPTSDSAPHGTMTFHSLREYVRGDELRHIHWRTSARVPGKLLVRRLIDTTLPEVTVVLDLTRSVWTPDAFEQGVEIVASILCACARAQFPAKLLLTTGELVQPKDGPLEQRFLDHLVQVEPTDDDGLDNLLTRLANQGNGSAVVVVTGSSDVLRLALLSTLGRRFQHVISVLVQEHDTPKLTLAGVSTIHVETSAEFAQTWRRATVSAGAPA